MSLTMCEVPVHPVEFLTEADIAAFPELPMTQGDDGTYFCDGESTQDGTPSPDNSIPIINTYKAGTYKAICGDKTFKVVLDDDLRSVPGFSDRVTIDPGRGVMRIEKKVNVLEFDGSNDEKWYYASEIENYFRVWVMQTGSKGYTTPNAVMSEKFKSGRIAEDKGNSIFLTGNDKSGLINITVDSNVVGGTGLSIWKLWLESNPITVQYALGVPKTHQSIPTQLTTISVGKSATIENTVNDKADFLAVKGDSWQLVQKEITDEEGNVTQPEMPSPEYPSEILSVEGEMQSSGWNLCPTLINGIRIDSTNGQESNNNNYTSSYFIPFDINNEYYLNNLDERLMSYVAGYDKNQEFVGRTTGAQRNSLLLKKNSFTNSLQEGKSRDDIRYIRIVQYSTSNATVDKNKVYAPQLVKADGDLYPYDRHRGNSITLPILRGLSDGTRDVLYVDRKAKRAWIERNVGVAVFDGSEAWSLPTQNIPGFSFYRITNFFKVLHSDFVCTHLKCYVDTLYGEILDNGATSYPSSNQLIIVVENTIADSQSQTDVTEWTQYLKSQYDAGTPVTVQYALATPVIEELTYSDYLLETCQYQTNIQFTELDEHLEPEIGVVCKILGR